MNVLIINDWISTIAAGGTYRVQGFAAGLAEIGHKPLICTSWGVVEYSRDKMTHQPNVKSPGYYLTTTFPLLIQTIRSIIRRGVPDLAIIQMPSPITKALSILPLLKAFDIPVILDFGDPWWRQNESQLYAILSSYFAYLQARNSLLVTSPSKLILRLFRGINTIHLPNGVDLKLFRPTKQPGESGLIGFLGVFSERNGSRIIIPTLVELLKQNLNVRFLLVGQGEDLPVLLNEAFRKGVRKGVIVSGAVRRDMVPKLLSRAQILVAPYKEDPILNFIFPTKVPEMMALKKPVITAPLYEILTTFKVGEELLIAEYDYKCYSYKIASLLEDPNYGRKIAETGYKRIVRDFSWTELMRSLLKELSEKVQ